MKIDRIDVDGIEIIDRLRPADPDAVDRIAASMAKHGLMHPIKVHQYAECRCRLVSGLHRVLAARKLGWEFIDGVWVDDNIDPAEREMQEIAENLHRADLTALERDQQVARYAELAAEQSAQHAPKGLGHRPRGGVNEAARQLGIERTDVQRASKVASLSDEAKAVAVETELDDNRSALLEAAKEATPEAQVNKLAEIKRRKEDRKLINSGADALVKDRSATEAAALILEFFPADRIPEMLTYLDSAPARDIGREIRRQQVTGRKQDDKPVFDSTRSGRAA